MRRLLAIIPLCLLTAGCAGTSLLSRGESDGANGITAPKVGPPLDRLVDRIETSELTADEKQAYWEMVRGRRVSATGQIVEIGDGILLDCPLEKTPGRTVRVLAYPQASDTSALTMLRVSQELRVLGILTEKHPEANEKEPLIELRDARLIAR